MTEDGTETETETQTETQIETAKAHVTEDGTGNKDETVADGVTGPNQYPDDEDDDVVDDVASDSTSIPVSASPRSSFPFTPQIAVPLVGRGEASREPFASSATPPEEPGVESGGPTVSDRFGPPTAEREPAEDLPTVAVQMDELLAGSAPRATVGPETTRPAGTVPDDAAPTSRRKRSVGRVLLWVLLVVVVLLALGVAYLLTQGVDIFGFTRAAASDTYATFVSFTRRTGN